MSVSGTGLRRRLDLVEGSAEECHCEVVQNSCRSRRGGGQGCPPYLPRSSCGGHGSFAPQVHTHTHTQTHTHTHTHRHGNAESIRRAFEILTSCLCCGRSTESSYIVRDSIVVDLYHKCVMVEVPMTKVAAFKMVPFVASPHRHLDWWACVCVCACLCVWVRACVRVHIHTFIHARQTYTGISCGFCSSAWWATGCMMRTSLCGCFLRCSGLGILLNRLARTSRICCLCHVEGVLTTRQ